MKEEKSGPSPAGRKAVVAGKTPVQPVKVAPLFRKIDWVTFALTTLLILTGYLLTIAPQVTLEDSGELAVASQYAGVPHPPGYPVWTIYTWLFTKIIPFSNIAFRVAVSSAVAGAFACGLIGLLVSRGSSMMLESIDGLKDIEKRSEGMICMVCGFVAAMLMGFNGYMWSQAVIVEVYTLSVLSLMLTLCFLLRWMYAPEQHRYLYGAMFFFGICLTNHMSLLVAAVGILVLIAAANASLGRVFFIGSAICYAIGLVATAAHKITVFDNNTALFVVFNLIGLTTVVGAVVLIIKTQAFFKGFKHAIISLGAWGLGAVWYFYMPIASMSNPPLNWGYPRTAEGFIHAVKRGQYESVKPTDILAQPTKFVGQIGLYIDGAREEFTTLLLLVGLVPFVFIGQMKRRERAWLIGLAAIYLCLSGLLLVLLNPGLDRQSRELHKVFFTASHVIVSIAIGYGFALICGWLVRRYEVSRMWGLVGGGVAVLLALLRLAVTLREEFSVMEGTTGKSVGLFGGLAASLGQGLNFFPVVSGIVLVLVALGFVAVLAIGRSRVFLGGLLGVLLLVPLQSITSHWADNEQRGHLFGFWFGHDMFTPPFLGKDGKPLYPEMTQDAVLYGGTDPGRFNPTYMIFSESFIPAKDRTDPKFDRRDVVLITQNALADGTYLNYIRAHYNRSAQIDPPFFQKSEFTSWIPFARTLDTIFLGLGTSIEWTRRLGPSVFEAGQFKDISSLKAKLAGTAANRPVALCDYLKTKLSPETLSLLNGSDDAKFAKSLAKDLNQFVRGEDDNWRFDRFVGVKDDLWDKDRFAGVALDAHLARFVKRSPTPYERSRRNRLLLEAAFPEIARSAAGLYPDMEILTASQQDSERCFNEYITDVQRRLQLKQVRPGEDVRIENGRVQVSGQVAVMAINGLLTKVIFDANPENDFFVEESFPLEWMYPHLTPFGVIMKINRQPVGEISQAEADKDHEFWSQYSDRLIGNWITYDTSVADICKWVERVYLLNDYSLFKGDRAFARDDNAQKAFSKLRSSIGGVYAWRLGLASGSPTPPQYNVKTEVEKQRMLKEADFAFKQAFAFCPYSPEAVYRYVNLLMATQRFDDAILIAKTCLLFDEDNDSIRGLVESLQDYKQPKQSSAALFDSAMKGIDDALKVGQTNAALQLIDQIIQSPKVDAPMLMQLASSAMKLQQYDRVENALTRLTQIQPNNPEAFYDLAVVRSMFGKPEAMAALGNAVRLSNERLKKDPAASDLAKVAAAEARFQPFHSLPEFQQALLGK
jgi:tetratricopeptide (TPR) repeat protein